MQLVLSGHHVRSAALALTLLLATSHRAHAGKDITADSLVGPEWLSGPGWQVSPRAEIRGYQARFVIHTDWGTLHADSVELLALRVSEMPALRALHAQDISDALAATGARRVSEPTRAAGNIIRQPLRTVTGLPRGITHYFGDRWRRIGKIAQRLADDSREALTEDGSAFDAVAGPLGAAGQAQRHDRSWWGKRGREVNRLIKREIGYSATRRALAEQLGIDPYTGNELITPQLDAMAWAQTGGHWASGQALALVAGPAALLAGYATQVDRWVLSTSPEQVRERNRLLLTQWCPDDRLLRDFLRNGAFTPALQTALTDQLAILAPAAGCEALLETALMADNEAQARFVVADLRLLASYLGDASHKGRVVPLGALMAYETTTGEFILPLAVDWMSWTTQLQQWFDAPINRQRRDRTLLLSGGLSPKAQRELTRRGWSLVPRLPYPGAPPYKRI